MQETQGETKVNTLVEKREFCSQVQGPSKLPCKKKQVLREDGVLHSIQAEAGDQPCQES